MGHIAAFSASLSTFTKSLSRAYDVPRMTGRLKSSVADKRSINRRAFPRWPAPYEVRYGLGKDKLIDGKGVEIGEGGLSFVAAEPVQRETEMIVEYRLSGSTPAEWVRVKSIVRHSDGNTTGVEFLNLRRADRLKIVDFVSAVK